MSEEFGKSSFWTSFISAVGAEPRTASTIQGASGIYHPVEAIGLDDKLKRLIVVTNTIDAYSAAMVQADIQSALSDLKVIVTRPIAISLGQTAQALSNKLGSSSFDLFHFLQTLGDKEEAARQLEPILFSIIEMFRLTPVNTSSKLIQMIYELAKIKFAFPGLASESKEIESGSFKGIVNLEDLVKEDPMANDRELGICPFPLYEFDSGEVELFEVDNDEHEVESILRKHDILQYFYPSPDQMLLGLIDRGVRQEQVLLGDFHQVQNLGHPFGPTELIPQAENFKEMIKALQDHKLMTEGEFGYEISEKGLSIRSTVKVKPREGLISKVLNRFSVNLDLSKLFTPRN